RGREHLLLGEFELALVEDAAEFCKIPLGGVSEKLAGPLMVPIEQNGVLILGKKREAGEGTLELLQCGIQVVSADPFAALPLLPEPGHRLSSGVVPVIGAGRKFWLCRPRVAERRDPTSL